MEYTIQPVLMGGLVKEVTSDYVKIHIHGRLGVITIAPEYITSDEPVRVGHDLKFYFSYLRVTDEIFDMDLQGMHTVPPFPVMLYGTITEVNDTAIKASIGTSAGTSAGDGIGEIGTVAVPLRFVFTDIPLKTGLSIEVYLSNMQVVGFKDIPSEQI